MVKSRLRQRSPVSVCHSPQELSPRPSSAFDDLFDITIPSSRPTSDLFTCGTNTSSCAMVHTPPTLTEILLDVASPPWTLSAFMAYLSQNHCMETLEFTLDSQRYAAIYNELIVDAQTQAPDANERVCSLWEKMIQVYIIPCAPREVNIPARVRDRLLSITSGPSPPHPSELDEAGRIVFELMNDSLLVPFLQSVCPMQLEGSADAHARSPRFLPHLSVHQAGGSVHVTQTHESEGLTDDSDGNSPPTTEPMTPPTTPPTAEWSFGASSPGGFQRAVAAHNKGWKKMGAKLGFSRKSSSRRTTPTSSTSGADIDLPVNNSL